MIVTKKCTNCGKPFKGQEAASISACSKRCRYRIIKRSQESNSNVIEFKPAPKPSAPSPEVTSSVSMSEVALWVIGSCTVYGLLTGLGIFLAYIFAGN